MDKLITHNFRLNALANAYAVSLFNHITVTGGGNFQVKAGETPITVTITEGVSGVRDLIDGFFLEVVKSDVPEWEDFAIKALSNFVRNGELTSLGRSIWQDMKNDMGATIAESRK